MKVRVRVKSQTGMGTGMGTGTKVGARAGAGTGTGQPTTKPPVPTVQVHPRTRAIPRPTPHNTSHTSHPSASTPSPSVKPPGRIRQHLRPASAAARHWNPNSPDTPEGRLVHYNPEDWHAPAKDERGHSNSLRIEFPPEVMEELSKHVLSGRYPLGNSIQQAIRVSVWEFLQILRRLEPVRDSNMELIETLNALSHHAEITTGYESKFRDGKEAANKLLGMGAWNEARKLVADMLVLAKNIPSKELKSKYVGDLKNEFKGLLKVPSTNVVKGNVRANQHSKKRKKLEDWEV